MEGTRKNYKKEKMTNTKGKRKKTTSTKTKAKKEQIQKGKGKQRERNKKMIAKRGKTHQIQKQIEETKGKTITHQGKRNRHTQYKNRKWKPNKTHKKNI